MRKIKNSYELLPKLDANKVIKELIGHINKLMKENRILNLNIINKAVDDLKLTPYEYRNLFIFFKQNKVQISLEEEDFEVEDSNVEKGFSIKVWSLYHQMKDREVNIFEELNHEDLTLYIAASIKLASRPYILERRSKLKDFVDKK